MASPARNHGSILNFNVGVLGHVDSGKTSLSKALSTVASTASFDKNPQSKERGITLDLGFSSFSVDIPDHLKNGKNKYDQLQFTLVDCPGHASLIRTIIGGAQIIDLMMLVVDVTKGVQTQTAECLVIGEITCVKMIVVLNKIDLLPVEKRDAAVQKMTKRLNKTLDSTIFSGSPIISVAAKPGGPEAPETDAIGVVELIDTLKSFTYEPQRDAAGPLIYSVDHCFSIRGQGTVMTGTVLRGKVAVNDTVEIPSMKVAKKVKSMQMFKKSVEQAIQGDRVAICVTQFDPKQLERGLVCTQNALPTIIAAIITVKKIPYYKGDIMTKAKFHMTMGHETVMGKITLFGWDGDEVAGMPVKSTSFDYERDYRYQNSLLVESKSDENVVFPKEQFALVEFEKHVTCAEHCLVIGSRLDTDIHMNTCRLAFHGRMLEAISDGKYKETLLPHIRVYKDKCREGLVERKQDEYSIICRGLFKKESNIEMFTGLKVKLSTGEDGVIEGGFGQSGKFKVRIPEGLLPETNRILSLKGKKAKGKAAAMESAEPSTQEPASIENIRVILTFKRYLYDQKKRMLQT